MGRGKGGGEEEEEQRSRDPGAESDSEKDTARRPALFQWSLPFAARSGRAGTRGGGAASASRAPHLRDTPLVGRVRRAVARRGPRWRPWRGVGGRLLPSPLSVPSLERWGGPRPGELAPSAGAGTGEEVGAWERGVLREAGGGDGAPGRGLLARALEWSSCLAVSFKCC